MQEKQNSSANNADLAIKFLVDSAKYQNQMMKNIYELLNENRNNDSSNRGKQGEQGNG